jgi:arsenate reductase (thioredoxin)
METSRPHFDSRSVPPPAPATAANRVFHVLFLSRRNSARSLLAEAFLNKAGRGRFRAYSAGIEPAAAPDEHAIHVLRMAGFATEGLRPKHYSDFAGPSAHNLDFVFTLCDVAAGEKMPEWPGQPVTARWASADPVRAEGELWERQQAFTRSLSELERRLRIFMNLRFEGLDRMSLKHHVDAIGSAPRA